MHSRVAQSPLARLVRLFPARPSIHLLVRRRLRSSPSASDPAPTASSSGSGVTAFAITGDGQMSSSLIWGCSRCPRLIDWRANPDVETTDWRARRGKTAHRVRREGTAIAVSYPYPSAINGHSLRFPCGRLNVSTSSVTDIFPVKIPDASSSWKHSSILVYQAYGAFGTNISASL